MKNDLLKTNNLTSINKEVKFTYSLYMKAIKAISQDILKKNYLNNDNIGIIGIARGALPMLVSVSHFINHREVAVIQIQMSNSDNCYDYGEVRYLNDSISDNVDKYIVLEDIIYKGKSTNAVIDILKSRGKEVACVYALVVDEDFLKIKIPNDDVCINYCYKINRDNWVYFMWEEDLEEKKEEKND